MFSNVKYKSIDHNKQCTKYVHIDHVHNCLDGELPATTLVLIVLGCLESTRRSCRG